MASYQEGFKVRQHGPAEGGWSALVSCRGEAVFQQERTELAGRGGGGWAGREDDFGLPGFAWNCSAMRMISGHYIRMYEFMLNY